MKETRETGQTVEMGTGDVPTGGPKTYEGQAAMANALSDDTKLRINDVADGPVAQRPQGMAAVLDSTMDSLGNSTQETERLQGATSVHRGGKGVTIGVEGQGYHKDIPYVEDEG